MLDLLAGFVTELRNAGLPVSLTENLDAMEAVQHIPIEDREAFKYALGATMVKNNAHWRAFETVFEVYFSLRGPEYNIVDGDDEFDEMWRDMQEQMRQGDGKGAVGWVDGFAHARGDGPPVDAGTDEWGPGADACPGQAGSAALRRDGTRQARRWHLLPVSHASEPRPRLDARQADGGQSRTGRWRTDAAGGAARARRVQRSDRAVQEGDRSRDTSSSRGGPRCGSDGQDAAQAVARRRRVHACLTRRDAEPQEGAVPA